MIIPKDPSHPLYVRPGQDLRDHMIEYIRTHFSSTLGTAVGLLDMPDGLDQLQEVVAKRQKKEAPAVRKAA